jgi:hypothetical protein
MQITARTLLASVAASAALGGGIGALATAATSSQASPQSIAAAVQRVRDQRAENVLVLMNLHLSNLESDLQATNTHLESLEGHVQVIEKNGYLTCFGTTGSNIRPECSR